MALALSKGDIVVAMDDDDVYGAGYVQYMVEYLLAHPEAQLISLSGSLGMSVRKDGSVAWSVGKLGEKTGSTFVFRRAVYSQHGCMYTNKTGSDEWALYQCIHSIFGAHGTAQVDVGEMTPRQAYVKTQWAFQTVMQEFDNPYAAKVLEFATKSGDQVVTHKLRLDWQLGSSSH